MGLISSRTETPPLLDIVPLSSNKNYHARQGSARSRARQPMPDPAELDKRFVKVLASMDLPPDKAKLLRSYDNEKKWEIICDQDMVQAKGSPAHYLNKLKTYLDPKASRSHRKRKMVGESTSTQVLRDLEISLRTNHIEWVKEFLDEKNQGLDVLVDYLSFRLSMMRHEQRIEESRMASDDGASQANSSLEPSGGRQSLRPPLTSAMVGGAVVAGVQDGSPSTVRRRTKHAARLNMGASTDDIHVCIMCMRAIMNNKYGFNMVIQHREAINSIALSLVHHSLRTKALVLELLAAICLVKGGHRIILSAFDSFKLICEEEHRFCTLMEFFKNFENFHIEFMVACMQFVNIIVHSVEDMNFRVHLQYEFTSLGLDQYLEKLRLNESEELQVQISAYLDNVFDVAALMEDSETKTAALERAAELEDALGHANERMNMVEVEALNKLASLEGELGRLRGERDQLDEARRQVAEEVSTLRRAQMDSRNRQSMLENKIQELETVALTLPRGSSMGSISSHLPAVNGYSSHPNQPLTDCSDSFSPNTPQPVPNQLNLIQPNINSFPPPPPPVAVLPPPPPPPAPPAPPPAPPAPGMMMPPQCADAMTIKRKVHTKYKLPTLNWIALKPNQVRGTIFNELDEEKLTGRIDFMEFEERFKIGISMGGLSNQTNTDVDGLNSSKRFKKPDNVSLLEHTRLRNIAISRRKLEIPVEKVIVAINTLDLKQLPLESVEILQRMVPTEQESKAYREYVAEKKNINLLTEEDKFLLQLTKVERTSAKLSIMSYMGNFFDNLHLITPQIHAIISGSSSVKSSQKLRSVLEIILAFGNYLNSSKRGPAYGFKLQSLDTLLDTKSTDKKMSLLHYIVTTIRAKFPELLNFESELLYIDKAAQVSLENVVADVHEFEKGMDAVRKEAEMRGSTKSAHNMVLRDFLSNSEEKLKRLKSEVRVAQDSFRECVEYFGEAPRSCDANAFFSLLVRFSRAFKVADQDNEQRRRLELAALKASQPSNRDPAVTKVAQKKQQDAVINELKSKTHLVCEKKLLQQDEVYNGALEDILLGLRSEPYRRADAVRRSHRRRINSHRFSKGADELDV